MSLDDDGNYDTNALPFANCELATDIHSDIPVFQKLKKSRKTKAKNKQQTNGSTNDQNINLNNIVSYIYFENSEEENNFLSFIPYTGPSNTLHLERQLYVPQLITVTTNDSMVSCRRFIYNYDRAITSITPSLVNMSLVVYLRFGISYIIRADPTLGELLSIKDFTIFRNRGKQIKTAFYTCKGVTSPKHLLTTISKLNYHQISSNAYSYDMQLYGMKSNQYSILHFQYDEQFQCRTVLHRPDYPINFDFIRNKSSSIFRSIDDSYSDIFDFRIQLVQGKYLSKTDPDVLDILRGVPIDQVLFLDKSTHVLHVSSKLQKFVKYLKCTRSSNYQNFDEQVLISIGSYEEFRLNHQAKCELLMKAENTMTIELLDQQNIPAGKKLYDIGMWFSTLCQACVDLPSATLLEKNANKSSRWFSDISVFRKKHNESIKRMNVNQLTTYNTQKSEQSYTSEELAFVRKILQEENLRNILLNTNGNKCYDRKDVEQIFERIKKRLKTSGAPSANEALKKVERAYRTVYEDFV